MYKCTVCDPLIENIIEKGELNREEIIEFFHTFEWEDMLNKKINAKESEIYYSPSLEFINTKNNSKLTISAIENSSNLKKDGYVYYIFYSEPSQSDNLHKEILDQSHKDAIKVLNKFISDDYSALKRLFDTPRKQKKTFLESDIPALLIVIFLVSFFLFLKYK